MFGILLANYANDRSWNRKQDMIGLLANCCPPRQNYNPITFIIIRYTIDIYSSAALANLFGYYGRRQSREPTVTVISLANHKYLQKQACLLLVAGRFAAPNEKIISRGFLKFKSIVQG